jgi:hypothetical protein
MRNLYFIALIALFAACSENASSDEDTTTQTVEGRYGDSTWVANNPISTTTLLDSLQNNDSVFAVVTGKINEACQAKGCWMSMDAAGQEIFVKFKDYGFFVPKNSAGYNATMQGWAYADTVSVADQIEKIKDSKKSDKEKDEAIAAITEPKVNLTFMADGVIIE